MSDEFQRYFCYAEQNMEFCPTDLTLPWSDFESLFGSMMNLITKAWFSDTDNQIVISNTQWLKLTAVLIFCSSVFPEIASL